MRVELGGIEASLEAALPGFLTRAVVTWDPEDASLAAHVVPAQAGKHAFFFV